MKKILLIVMFISGVLYAQNEAYDALNVLEPLIGKWQTKEMSYGFFEGLPDNTEMVTSNEYKWITEKSAILGTWEAYTTDGKQKINHGSILFYLDPATKSIRTKHFGYDGKVYWTGNGRIENRKNSLAVHIEELTINGTHTAYTNEIRIINNDTYQSQFVNINQGGKPIEDHPNRNFKRVK